MAAVICVEPAAIGEFCSIAAISDFPSFVMIDGSITEIGSGLLNGVTLPMREPVMTTASPSSSICAVLGACAAVSLESCARAGEKLLIAKPKIAAERSAVAPRKVDFAILCPLLHKLELRSSSCCKQSASPGRTKVAAVTMLFGGCSNLATSHW
jgi:hypothetical protein